MISAFTIIMLPAISFYGNLPFRRVEVQDIVVDRKLASEFNPTQTSIA